MVEQDLLLDGLERDKALAIVINLDTHCNTMYLGTQLARGAHSSQKSYGLRAAYSFTCAGALIAALMR